MISGVEQNRSRVEACKRTRVDASLRLGAPAPRILPLSHSRPSPSPSPSFANQLVPPIPYATRPSSVASTSTSISTRSQNHSQIFTRYLAPSPSPSPHILFSTGGHSSSSSSSSVQPSSSNTMLSTYDAPPLFEAFTADTEPRPGVNHELERDFNLSRNFNIDNNTRSSSRFGFDAAARVPLTPAPTILEPQPHQVRPEADSESVFGFGLGHGNGYMGAPFFGTRSGATAVNTETGANADADVNNAKSSASAYNAFRLTKSRVLRVSVLRPLPCAFSPLFLCSPPYAFYHCSFPPPILSFPPHAHISWFFGPQTIFFTNVDWGAA